MFLTYSAVRHEEMRPHSAFTTFTAVFQLKCLTEKVCVWVSKVKGWMVGVAVVTLGEPNSRLRVMYENCFSKRSLVIKKTYRKALMCFFKICANTH